MELLDSPIRKYAWGSQTAIATLQGRPAPTAEPEAELWMGAHPASPSRLAVSGTPLTDAIAADPEGLLGPAGVERFGTRLPFLLKILAAAHPLSLQAHPTLERARDLPVGRVLALGLEVAVRHQKDRRIYCSEEYGCADVPARFKRAVFVQASWAISGRCSA